MSDKPKPGASAPAAKLTAEQQKHEKKVADRLKELKKLSDSLRETGVRLEKEVEDN